MSAERSTYRVSVIIPMRNAASTIQNCLHALDRQTMRPYEVIVIDNDSTDDSMELVQSLSKGFANLNLQLGYEKERGPAAARNTAIALSDGDILAFTDSDCIPEPNWIEKIVHHFQQDTVLDVLGGIEKRVPHAQSTVGKLMSYAWLPRRVQTIMRNKDQFFSGHVVATFNCAARREIVLGAEGFDTSFRLAGEDADLWFRAFNRGARIAIWVPDVIVMHKQEISLSALLKKMLRYGEAEAHLMQRHFSGLVILKDPRGRFFKMSIPRGTLAILSVTNILFFSLIVGGLLTADVISTGH